MTLWRIPAFAPPKLPDPLAVLFRIALSQHFRMI